MILSCFAICCPKRTELVGVALSCGRRVLPCRAAGQEVLTNSILFCKGNARTLPATRFRHVDSCMETGQFLVVCSEVRAFIFVFEEQHRIVLETPEYGNATYFFELEAPMPVAAQVRFETQAGSKKSFQSQSQTFICGRVLSFELEAPMPVAAQVQSQYRKESSVVD